jgi:hypothetical protein
MEPTEVCACTGSTYDLILLDLQMPGMDGFRGDGGTEGRRRRQLPAGDGADGPARPQAARAAGRRQGLHQQALRPAGGQASHPQHARGAAAVPGAGSAQPAAGAQGAERTAELRESEARFRSLTELASDWYWEQDEAGEFTKVSGPVLEMLGITTCSPRCPTAEFDPLAMPLAPVSMTLGRGSVRTGSSPSVRLVSDERSGLVALRHGQRRRGRDGWAWAGKAWSGVPLFMGGGTMPGAAVVQTAGLAYRLDRARLQKAFAEGGLLQHLLLRYTQALITQMSQTAACNRHHSVEQQLARWLLLTLDRLPAGELVMTQELVASMLGVRRESVTEAAGRLQQMGHIRSRRGHIAVVDRAGLESRSCECYGAVKVELSRLMRDPRYRQELPATT